MFETPSPATLVIEYAFDAFYWISNKTSCSFHHDVGMLELLSTRRFRILRYLEKVLRVSTSKSSAKFIIRRTEGLEVRTKAFFVTRRTPKKNFHQKVFSRLVFIFKQNPIGQSHPSSDFIVRNTTLFSTKISQPHRKENTQVRFSGSRF